MQLLLVFGTMTVRLSELIDERTMIRPLLLQHIDPPQRLLDEVLPRMRLLMSFVLVAPQMQCLNEERKRQPVADERDQDDGEGDHDERIPRREGRSARERERDRERSGQRDDATHPGPRQQDDFGRAERLRFARDEPLPGGHAEDPQGSHREEGDAHDDA